MPSRYKVILLCIMLVPNWQVLDAVTWAVMPARFSGEMPALADGFETSRQLTLYLEYGGLQNFVPPRQVAAAYQALGLTPAAAVSSFVAAQLADHSDAERLLFLHIQKRGREFRVESRVYHRESGLTTDSLSNSNTNLYFALGEHARLRFPQYLSPPTLIPQPADLVVITEAGGGNYFELLQFAGDISALSVRQSALCAVDAAGNLVASGFLPGTKTLAQRLRSLNARGSEAAQHLSRAASCAAELVRRHNTRNALFVLLVSDVAIDAAESNRLKGQLRSLVPHGRLLILGSGSLTASARDFYQNLADDLGMGNNNLYEDILYRIRIGLANGEAWYIFKRGGNILESREAKGDNAVAVPVPAHRRMDFRPEKLLETYKDLSKNKIVSVGKTEILLLEPLLAFSGNAATSVAGQPIRRVLLQFPEGSFWFSIPQAVFQRNQNLLQTGRTVTMAVVLAPPRDGMPLVNDPSFVKIFSSAADAPRELFLPLPAYLNSPDKFLQQSIGGSSLYVIQGRLADIRLPRGDVLE